MNTQLFREIQKQIQKTPEKFSMSCFLTDQCCYNPQSIFQDGCGATACIAGWAIVLSGVTKYPEELCFRKATVLLQLSDEQGQRLFFDCYWPTEFLPSTSENAVKRIEHFIETNGEE